MLKRITTAAAAFAIAATTITPVLAEDLNRFECDFENYDGGDLIVSNNELKSPWLNEFHFGGKSKQFYSAETSKGKSMWISIGDSESGDQFITGSILNSHSTESYVMQFDVMPLGLGSKTLFGFVGEDAQGKSVFQNLFQVYPDGSLQVYARGTISDGNSISEQCYTEYSAVTLRKGNKTNYQDSAPVTIPVDKWSNLAAVYRVSESAIDYYVNGKLIFSNAIPFNFGNSLKSTGIKDIRIQAPKFGEYSALDEAGKKKVGLYLDNFKVIASAKPDEYTPEESGDDDQIPTDDAYYINENFEEYTGGRPGALGGRFTDQMTAVKTEYGMSLWMRSSKKKMISTGGSATDNYCRPVLGEGLEDDLVFQADFKPIGGNNYTYLSLCNAANKKVGGIRVYNDGRITYYDGTAENSESSIESTDGGIVSCPSGEWINIAVVFKLKKKTIDVYVNRQPLVKDSPMYTGTGVEDYRYINIQQTIYNDEADDALDYENQGVYLDNIKIYRGSYLFDNIVYYKSNFDQMQNGSYISNDLSKKYLENGSCKIEENDDGNLLSLGSGGYIKKIFDDRVSGVITAVCDIKVSANTQMNLFAVDDIVPIQIQNGMLVTQSGEEIASISENETYRISAEFNFAKGTFCVSSDGNKKDGYLIDKNSVKEIKIESISGTALIDNVEIAEKTEIPEVVRVRYFSNENEETNPDKLTKDVNKIKLYFSTSMREPDILTAVDLKDSNGNKIAYTAEYDRSENSLLLNLQEDLKYFEKYNLKLSKAMSKQWERKNQTVSFKTNASFTAFETSLVQDGKALTDLSQAESGKNISVKLNVVSNSEEEIDFVLCAVSYKDGMMIGINTENYIYNHEAENKFGFDILYDIADEINILVLKSNEKPIPLYDAAIVK